MDRYTVLKVIGEGSFGRALLVQLNTDKVKWVTKEIRLPKAEGGVQSARTEAVLLSTMTHPNIVAFRESFEDDGHLYIVMEFCSGGDLLQKIRQQNGSLFPEDVNIFLTDHGTIKLGDFGSACALNSAKGYAQTYVGTPYYVSPEIWDNQPYNNKSDVWSLGCVLYELCTLRHPFEARSWKSLILKVCRGSYTPLPSRLPYELHYLIKHMFKTNPRDRPSIHTILNSHRVSRLLHKHLPEEQLLKKESKELAEKRVNQWRKEEGEKVAMFLGQKSLLNTTTTKDPDISFKISSENRTGNNVARKRWAKEPSNTVLQVFRNADIISSGDTATAQGSDSTKEVGLTEMQKLERRQWDKDPPERLLSLLDKAPLSTAFSTYIIHRHNLNDDDVPDGPDVHVDQNRLEPRSDDEDTDFEEDCQFDWQAELEKMFVC
ncbi:serine/threonine-protein kinase Nek3 isoform X2 [Tachysurus fulvidraco]|uniref:serine/threonine-protein kinase Nek3 isoform X2 n=1 Tax=Tachysurus fulvidraco TaxID=1234273 RepID=UPI001FEED542|nr:serine/threonine-protein kinase Nek3 isoform X2 [Tachysurus fulvidraco]